MSYWNSNLIVSIVSWLLEIEWSSIINILTFISKSNVVSFYWILLKLKESWTNWCHFMMISRFFKTVVSSVLLHTFPSLTPCEWCMNVWWVNRWRFPLFPAKVFLFIIFIFPIRLGFLFFFLPFLFRFGRFLFWLFNFALIFCWCLISHLRKPYMC